MGFQRGSPMVQSKRPKIQKQLTEVELELMNSVWDLGECTIKDVQNALPAGRNLAYTSVATIIKILEQKGFLGSRKGDKAHSYYPLVTRGEYESVSLKHMAENLFRGDQSSMVMRLLNDSELSRQELKAIQDILKERLAKS